ncbi:NAD-dependent epimerase/dehydratase family protein [Paenibacillus profundus]|uniref:NAD-dependent epimerase/dehydratase family protein n=1 Tax=Paenibacillus profundus TaxID=1173085 RepID=A0ABS8YEU7_9BACL|nr:NAD-dependent epimerase/dehydratase family protein [Paenibacillus profundus]MCE5170176.1 NAD-dependent epimerase/dehydratase family protein [Paenibacillus profundus]
MRIVVTGGAGFIGSHLVDALISQGHEVHILDNLSTGGKSYVTPQAVLHELDIAEEAAGREIELIQPEIVFHLAAQADVKRSIAQPVIDMRTNIQGTLVTLAACLKAKVRHVVLASTSAVYGDIALDTYEEHQPPAPLSCYGLSKLTAERYLQLFARLHGLNGTILRFANVYGPRQTPKGEGGVIALFIDRLHANAPLTIHGDGEQTRDFIFVGDVVDACLRAAECRKDGLWQVGTGKTTSINELVYHLLHICGKPAQLEKLPQRLGDIRHSCLSYERLRQDMGWSPKVSLLEGLERTYHAYNAKES